MRDIVDKNGGFTLVEMIIAVAIVAVLTALAVPKFTFYIQEHKLQADIISAGMIANKVEKYILSKNKLPVCSSGFRADDFSSVDAKYRAVNDYVKKELGEVPTPKSKRVTGDGHFYITIDNEGNVAIVNKDCTSQYYPKVDGSGGIAPVTTDAVFR